MKERSFHFRHRLISKLRDFDVRGIRRLSVILPKLLLPNPSKVEKHILKTIHGPKLIIDPAVDNGVERSLFETGTYEKGILHFIKKTLPKNGVFVDVGANIGSMSIVVANWFPLSKVYAFEAHPDTFKILSENIVLNGLSNIDSYSLALGNTIQQTQIYDNWHVNRGGASLVVRNDQSKEYRIEMTKLDNVIDSTVPDIIKIDVEGVELEVLKGAYQTICKHLPVLIVEISNERENSHDSPVDIFNFISRIGAYSIFKLKGSKERVSELIEVRTSAELPQHDNIICIATK